MESQAVPAAVVASFSFEPTDAAETVEDCRMEAPATVAVVGRP